MNHDEIISRNEEYFNTQWSNYSSLDNMGDQSFIKHLLRCTNSVPEDWKNKNVFEGGAGTGRNTIAALELGVSYIVATELSQGGVDSVRQNIRTYSANQQDVYRADLTNLEVEKDDTYDIVFSINCLPHIPDYKKALSEMVRICKPGGLVMFNVNPKRSKLIAMVDNKIREHTTKMCPHCLKEFAKIMTYWANTPLIRNALRGVMELSGDELSAYDHFGLPFTQECSQEEITKVMEELECEILAVNNHIAVKARKK